MDNPRPKQRNIIVCFGRKRFILWQFAGAFEELGKIEMDPLTQVAMFFGLLTMAIGAIGVRLENRAR